MQTVGLYCFPRVLDRRVALGLAELPVVNAESPVAAERIRRLIGWWSPTLPRITAIPHPVDERDLVASPSVERRQRIVGVGRWDAHQKDFPLFLRTVSAFLKDHPDWDAVIVGGILERMERHRGLLAAEVRERVKFTGPIPHTELAGHLYSSRILLVTSKHESFHIGAAEGLPALRLPAWLTPGHIMSMEYFAGSDSGTVGHPARHGSLSSEAPRRGSARLEGRPPRPEANRRRVARARRRESGRGTDAGGFGRMISGARSLEAFPISRAGQRWFPTNVLSAIFGQTPALADGAMEISPLTARQKPLTQSISGRLRSKRQRHAIHDIRNYIHSS